MKMFSLDDVISNAYFLIGGVFLGYLIYKILQSLLCDNYFVQTKFKNRGHMWRTIQCNKSIPYNICCNVCCKLMLPTVGLFCECCGISACNNCYKVINNKSKCKYITWQYDKPFLHHWVNVGTVRGDSVECTEENMTRYFCNWCQRVKLVQGDTTAEECDFNKYRNIIIPPMNVQMEKGSIVNIKRVERDDWEPLFIFANRKSGGNRGDEVLSLFRGILNPIQVIDLSETRPEEVARWAAGVVRGRALVAGGDGTVGWVLSALHTQPQLQMSVGIIPMGTGNDLSRALGWGPTCGSEIDAHALIASVIDAVPEPLDRWKITIRPKRGRLVRSVAESTVFAYNYASIGVDAQVALDFHRARTQFLYRYANRTLNYLTYLVLGAGRALEAGRCESLERRLRVRTDGAPLPLPPLQALVLLNIPYWGAGVRLWSMGSDNTESQEQSICDKKIEVVGISSSFHIARLQCGLAEPYRFTQAQKVKIELDGACAMQVDGEPWMQKSATITVEHAGQCSVLRPPITDT